MSVTGGEGAISLRSSSGANSSQAYFVTRLGEGGAVGHAACLQLIIDPYFLHPDRVLMGVTMARPTCAPPGPTSGPVLAKK